MIEYLILHSIGVLLGLVAAGAWCFNFYKFLMRDEYNGKHMSLLRILGIVIFPLGVIMGFVPSARPSPEVLEQEQNKYGVH